MAVPAFDVLFERELPFVLRALRRLGVRDGDLADVAQELFVLVHERLHELTADAAVRRWLHAFCLRFASNYRRLARHRGVSLDEHEALQSAADADGAARSLVHAALEALDYDQRVAFVLHDLEGYTAPEIADLTQAPINTVYSRIRLGRVAFRQQVEKLNRGGDHV